MRKNIITVTLALVVLAVSAFFILNNGKIMTSNGETFEEPTSVTFVYKNKKFVYGLKDYDIDSEIHSIKQELKARIKPTHQERSALAKSIVDMGFSYKEAVEYAFFNIDKIVMNAKKNIDKAPADAEIFFAPQNSPMFSYKNEKVGFDVDLEPLYKEIYEALMKSSKARIELKPRTLNAEVTVETLRTATGLRSRFSTHYSASTDARKHNVRLALKKFNGLRINPGDTVSFNSIVGARSVRNGFMEAKIILNGRFENGVGGGVCQSSTTLYNAVLLADLSVKKAGQHSLPVAYVEPSFDAMVNSSGSDLVFANGGELPVFIRTYWDEENVTVEVYGTPLPYQIRRRSVTTGTLPHSGDIEIVDVDGKYTEFVQYKGDKARVSYPKDGLTSTGYLDYYKNGVLLESKLIRKNKYAPQQGLIVEGTQERPPAPPPILPDSEKEQNSIFPDFIRDLFGRKPE